MRELRRRIETPSCFVRVFRPSGCERCAPRAREIGSSERCGGAESALRVDLAARLHGPPSAVGWVGNALKRRGSPIFAASLCTTSSRSSRGPSQRAIACSEAYSSVRVCGIDVALDAHDASVVRKAHFVATAAAELAGGAETDASRCLRGPISDECVRDRRVGSERHEVRRAADPLNNRPCLENESTAALWPLASPPMGGRGCARSTTRA